MKRTDDNELNAVGIAPPCKHMEGMLNRTADDTAGRIARWFTLLHVAQCGPCRAYLKFLREIVGRLRRGKETPPEDVMERLAEKVSQLEV